MSIFITIEQCEQNFVCNTSQLGKKEKEPRALTAVGTFNASPWQE